MRRNIPCYDINDVGPIHSYSLHKSMMLQIHIHPATSSNKYLQKSKSRLHESSAKCLIKMTHLPITNKLDCPLDINS